MKILTVNAGSSSLKFNVIELPKEEELISGYFEKIGMDDSFYNIKIDGVKTKHEVVLKNHLDAVECLKKELFENNIIKDLSEIDGVGHRLVHGGDKFKDSVLLTDEVIEECKQFNDLAPLHNPAMLACINAFKSAMPSTPMVGVFDTSFHQTMPIENFLYSVPYSWYTEYKIRKYGFHGTSHKYITKVMKEKLGKDNINIINCHVGSGGSICCIKDGKSFDTTMGFSPNAGITMGTRCGDIDYSIIKYYASKTGLTLDEIDLILNKQSGLLGISGVSADHRDVEAAMEEGNERAILSNEIYVQKVANYIAEYYLKLDGKVDAITLTAGTGENARGFRKDLLNKLGALGIYLDEKANDEIAGFKDLHEGIISTKDSKIPVYVVPTNEELMIALDTYDIINK